MGMGRNRRRLDSGARNRRSRPRADGVWGRRADDTPAAAATTRSGNAPAADNGRHEPQERQGGDGGDTAETADTDDAEDTIKVDTVKDIPDGASTSSATTSGRSSRSVKDVDWANADLSAMEDIGSELDSVASGMDDEMTAAGCDKYELSATTTAWTR